jgi:hypothetical protein
VPRRPNDVIEFHGAAPAELVALMDDLSEAGGWINLQPGFHPDDAPAESALFGLLAGRGAALPMCTWKPHEYARDGTAYVALGVQHGTGGRVTSLLAARGAPIPDAWVVLQDSPRHGLIVAASPTDPHDQILDWLLQAGARLSPIPLTGDWRALIYRR